MFKIVVIQRLFFRKLLPLFLFTYLVVILLFIVNVDQTNLAIRDIDFGLPVIKEEFSDNGFIANNTIDALGVGRREDFLQPMHVMRTQGFKASTSKGDFIVLGKEAFVYSAYMDDRGDPAFVRILAMFSKSSSRFQSVYCHFNGTATRKAMYYELCENHGKIYGGFIYSCIVPNTTKADNLATVVVSLSKFGPRVAIPLLKIRPPQNKLWYLDKTRDMQESLRYRHTSSSVPSLSQESVSLSFDTLTKQLSFAICVSPLFGDISVFRLIEFIELSKLLGANHIYFYNYSLHQSLEDVLLFYVRQNQITVLPWKLPSQMSDDLVWYHGQLLSNNDCLYRTMSRHDLVSFNDLDEFIVPHSDATTWRESFGQFLQDDQCGYSFQSAFYNPGSFNTYPSKLLTPLITVKTQKLSKIRTKVMLCPWRVFEVGIHHISKQSKEVWRPAHVDPSFAYLHHYRQCAADYRMDCHTYENDSIIATRYAQKLTRNFESVLKTLYEQNILNVTSS
ncbi:beta-1,4-galactosyltransferase galt-1-like [Biomphalaria glabrata]|uniref:Glycosyltransferase family 92 protein n=1 Tax=Biomphalaria glabrata TaxID=6526 RepID=A0A9U8DUQ1_BIOGL|nr:beta-1,4-galactosyltransferase galt-1-like [Biomphalaria glabrata]XP_013061069.2 beta-1,4-galactosyltransferase galt-1-like [Biomphalaria glabrata]